MTIETLIQPEKGAKDTLWSAALSVRNPNSTFPADLAKTALEQFVGYLRDHQWDETIDPNTEIGKYGQVAAIISGAVEALEEQYQNKPQLPDFSIYHAGLNPLIDIIDDPDKKESRYTVSSQVDDLKIVSKGFAAKGDYGAVFQAIDYLDKQIAAMPRR